MDRKEEPRVRLLRVQAGAELVLLGLCPPWAVQATLCSHVKDFSITDK